MISVQSEIAFLFLDHFQLLPATFSDFVDVATALEGFFDSGGHLDVTASDILLGLILLSRQQNEAREACRTHLKRAVVETERFISTRSNHSTRLSRFVRKFANSSRALAEEAKESSDDDSSYKTADEELPVIMMNEEEEQQIETAEAGLRKRMMRDGSMRQSMTSLVCRRRMSIVSETAVELSNFFEPSEREILNKFCEEDKKALLEGAHFMKMALGVYGLIMYMVHHPGTGCCRLGMRYFNCSCRENVKGDLFRCHRVAFLEESGLDHDSLVYATFRSGVKRRPYCIVIDKKWKAVVVIVRGTLSLEDAVADIQLKPQPMDECGRQYNFDGDGEYCHAGMFGAAEWVYCDLESHGLLKTLLVGENCQCPNYSLYVVGHSLGAGVASILSLMLHKDFPDLKSLCFAPPGCVMSPSLAEQDFITSYVVGTDIVPRLSLSSLENLRDDILEVIAKTKVPKHTVFALNPFSQSKSPTGSIFHLDHAVPNSQFARQLKEFKGHHQSRRVEAGMDGVILVPPGKRIVHMIKTSEHSKNCCGGVEFDYTPIWARHEDFSVIALSSSFFSDHDPASYAAALQGVAESFTAC